MSHYKRVRALFPDHHGLARGKYIPHHLSEDDTRHCISLFALALDRTMTPAPGAMLLEGLPDINLEFRVDDIRKGWEANTGIVVGDLRFQDQPVKLAPRYALRKAIHDLEALGYTPKVGLELEAYVLQKDENGKWVEWDTPTAYVYGTGMAVDPVGLFDQIMEVADDCDLPVESINSEYDTPQFELTLRYGDTLESVDNVFLFKLMARELAAKHGLLLTFLGRPFADRGGSGLHVNFSLEDKNGDNLLNNPDNDDGLSELAYQCIAGMLAHHQGMAALLAPTVNSYKRLQPGQLSGFWANWGHDHRGVTVRIPWERGRSTHLEHRMADGAANIYTSTATVLQAARLGIVNKLTPPPAEDLDSLENVSTEVHTPHDLREALHLLAADTELVEAVGPELVAHHIAIKEAEWEKWMGAVTDWELNYYLNFL